MNKIYGPINGFKDEHRWLSNFAPVKIILDNIVYSSVEHAYMSAKSNDPQWKTFCADANNTPGQVKRASRNIELIENWVVIKTEIMMQCLVQKYNQQPYTDLLLQTDNRYIEETNNWGDTFWGVCKNVGYNVLGQFIMQIRDDLQQNRALATSC